MPAPQEIMDFANDQLKRHARNLEDTRSRLEEALTEVQKLQGEVASEEEHVRLLSEFVKQ